MENGCSSFQKACQYLYQTAIFSCTRVIYSVSQSINNVRDDVFDTFLIVLIAHIKPNGDGVRGNGHRF